MICLATINNLKELVILENKMFSKYDYPLNLNNFRYHIKKEQVLLLKKNKRICGYLLFFKYKNSYRLYSLAVLNEFSNQGYGKQLLNAILERALKEKKNVSLEVRKSNTKALALYKNFGFKITKTLKSYYLDKEDAFKMYKFIS